MLLWPLAQKRSLYTLPNKTLKESLDLAMDQDGIDISRFSHQRQEGEMLTGTEL